jgi:hypothetical protein
MRVLLGMLSLLATISAACALDLNHPTIPPSISTPTVQTLPTLPPSSISGSNIPSVPTDVAVPRPSDPPNFPPPGGDPPVTRTRGDPWVAGICASDRNNNPACYAKARDRAMRELADKVFRKAVEQYFIRRPLRNFFASIQEQKTKDEELRETIKRVQRQALNKIEAMMMQQMATITPFDWSAEAMRGQVDDVVRRVSVEADAIVETAAQASEHHRPPITGHDGPAQRQGRKLNEEKGRWQGQ